MFIYHSCAKGSVRLLPTCLCSNSACLEQFHICDVCICLCLHLQWCKIFVKQLNKYFAISSHNVPFFLLLPCLFNLLFLPHYFLIFSTPCSSLLPCNATADLLLRLIQLLIWAYKFHKALWSLSPRSPRGNHESVLQIDDGVRAAWGRGRVGEAGWGGWWGGSGRWQKVRWRARKHCLGMLR